MNSLCRCCACKHHRCSEFWFCMLHVACVSRGIHVSVFSSIVGRVPSVLCVRWLAIPDVCHATRDTRGFQVSPSTIPSHTLEDRLQIVWIVVQSYWILKAQAEQLPSVLLPVGRTEITTFSKVQIFDSFVQKRITFSNEAWPHGCCQLMENIYAASKDCPFLIHAQQPPHASQNGKEYIVDLEPVGQPVLSKHFDQRAQSPGELKKSIRNAPLLAITGSCLP